MAGNSVGTCLILPLGGLLAGSAWGWRSIFYLTGASGLIWCILWLFLVYDSPKKHPRITNAEKKYIEQSIEDYQSTLSLPKTVPWKGILSSKAVWSVTLAHLASNWGVNQLNTLLPTYLNDVLK